MPQTPITPLVLYKYGFEKNGQELWIHLPTEFTLMKSSDDSYVQYLLDIKNKIGIPIRTKTELENRFLSFTGEKLILYETGVRPDSM